MDMDELSRNMYKNVPYGGTLFTNDKISLQIETQYLNMVNIKRWYKGKPINIMIYGNTAHINIHAEFEPLKKHLGNRCLNAILILLFDGVFNIDFTLKFNNLFFVFYPAIFYFDFLSVILLSKFFTIAEWENAIDFLDIQPFASIKTDITNPKSLKKIGSTLYSKDWKEMRRKKEENGEVYLELKGVQKSLICSYDRGAKINSKRLIYRVEIKQQGKYKKDLSIGQLDGTAEEAFYNMLPVLKKNINKVIEPDTFTLNKYWSSNTPEQYKKLFLNTD